MGSLGNWTRHISAELVGRHRPEGCSFHLRSPNLRVRRELRGIYVNHYAGDMTFEWVWPGHLDFHENGTGAGLDHRRC